jgi:hypothetical protein
MAGYVPIFRSIVQSTVWQTCPSTRCVWFAMMVLADRNGIVEGSLPGLAREAVVSLEECEQALATFMSPDKYSRTKTEEGRRVAEVDGGWQILNYAKYRDKLLEMRAAEANRRRVAKCRAGSKDRAESPPEPSPEEETNINTNTNVKGANGCVMGSNAPVMKTGCEASEASFEFECPETLEFEHKEGLRAVQIGVEITDLYEMFRGSRMKVKPPVTYCDLRAVHIDFATYLLHYKINRKQDLGKAPRVNEYPGRNRTDSPISEPRLSPKDRATAFDLGKHSPAKAG